MRLASIDIGTTSVKLLIADVHGKHLRPVLERIELTRLGEGLAGSDRLHAPAMDRTLKVLRKYRREAQNRGALSCVAVATEALRKAKNARHFLSRSIEVNRLPITIIDPAEEARLAFLGGTSGLAAQSCSAIDIGGGSTEVISGTSGVLRNVISLPVGALVLRERFLRHDPPATSEINRLRSYLRGLMRRRLKDRRATRLVAIGGTPVALAAMNSGRTWKTLHGMSLTVAKSQQVLDRLLRLPLGARRRLPGLDPDRADVLPAGLLLLIALCKFHGIRRFRISTRGLRHGLLLDRPLPIMSPL